jgi:hypothetical protein
MDSRVLNKELEPYLAQLTSVERLQPPQLRRLGHLLQALRLAVPKLREAASFVHTSPMSVPW